MGSIHPSTSFTLAAYIPTLHLDLALFFITLRSPAQRLDMVYSLVVPSCSRVHPDQSIKPMVSWIDGYKAESEQVVELGGHKRAFKVRLSLLLLTRSADLEPAVDIVKGMYTRFYSSLSLVYSTPTTACKSNG